MRDYRPAWGRLARAYEKRILLETKGTRLYDGGQTSNAKAGHSHMGRDLPFLVVRPEGVEPSTLGLKVPCSTN